MKRTVLLFVLSIAVVSIGLWGHTGCSGPSEPSEGVFEGGNPALRVIGGTVPRSAEGGCAADEAVATDSSSLATTSASVDGICTFSLSLTVERSYSIALFLGGTFITDMAFRNGPALEPSPSFFLSATAAGTDESTSIDLGEITISGNAATPQFQPAAQSDSDGDGRSDFDDAAMIPSEITTINMALGQDWEGQKKIDLTFFSTGELEPTQSIRFRYGEITNPRMSIAVGSIESPVTVVSEFETSDDPAAKILCAVINDFQTNQTYRIFIVGDASGTGEVIWEDGDTCGNPWPP